VTDDIVIEAMIKGLHPDPAAYYFARKPPHSLEKLLQKMDEYIREDNDFRQFIQEAQKYAEVARGLRGRFHPRHVQNNKNSGQNEDKSIQLQGHQNQPQDTSQALGAHLEFSQSNFRPLAPRGGKGFEALKDDSTHN
jgi:hypothetical protein